MHKTIIRSNSGKERLIYIPNADEKQVLRGVLDGLNNKMVNLCDVDIVHGFMPGKSPVTNSKKHIGFKYTLCMDIKDFFESVTPNKVEKLLTDKEIEKVFVDGAARQGLPTSPAVANIAGVGMDKALVKALGKLGSRYNTDIVYTRYADDLSISFNEDNLIEEIKSTVNQTVSRCGFKINHSKTVCQSSKAGRRIICGVAVDDDGIYPTREVKRRIRAAKHQGRENSLKGLEEWAKLKEPTIDFQIKKMLREAEELRKFWGLAKVDFSHAYKNKLIKKKDLGDDCHITNDPVYIMGMSTFTSGWTSCTRQYKYKGDSMGQYRRGVMGIVDITGISLAVRLGDTTTTIKGVTRRNMLARVMLLHCDDGKVYYNRMYGNKHDVEILKDKLHENNIMSVNVVSNTPRIKGVIKTRANPYIDGFKVEKVGNVKVATK